MVDPEREEIIRRAAKRINEEIDSLRFDFRDQDLGDVLSMILLSEETRLLGNTFFLKQESKSLQ